MTSQIKMTSLLGLLISLLLMSFATVQAEPLPSWHDLESRQRIVAFVEQVTNPDSVDFVPVQQRIAVFDNDGTLWSEQPVYFQLFFVMERVRALADQHPEWQSTQPFQAVLEGDMQTLMAAGEKGLLELLMATHAGTTTDEFSALVLDWLAVARHPRFDRPFTELVYQPMLELLDYLRAHEFQTWIVSGGGIEFMRPWAYAVYGVPPERIVGSSIKTRFELRDDKPVLVRLPEVNFIDDKEGKPVGVQQHIGQRPLAAFGNSDGDLQMLQWTTAGEGARLGVIIHHTDAEREWAYDRESHIGKLDKALDLATEQDWLIVDMQQDWKTIYSFPSSN